MDKQLGPIGVTFAIVNDHAQLEKLLDELVAGAGIPSKPANRFVLVVPRAIATFMGWPDDCAPRVEVHGTDLVFRRGS